MNKKSPKKPSPTKRNRGDFWELRLYVAGQSPNSIAVAAGAVSAVPDDHVAPLNVYTVAAPRGILPGSPTMAVVPFAETASDVPNELAEAGRVSAVPAESDVPL